MREFKNLCPKCKSLYREDKEVCVHEGCDNVRLVPQGEGVWTGTRAEDRRGGRHAGRLRDGNGRQIADELHSGGGGETGARGLRDPSRVEEEDDFVGHAALVVRRWVEWCRRHRVSSIIGFSLVLTTLIDSKSVSRLWYWARYAPPSAAGFRTEPAEPVKGDEVKLYLRDFKNPCNGEVSFNWDEPKSPIFGKSEPFVIPTKSTDPSELPLLLTVSDDCGHKTSIEQKLHLKEKEYPNPQIDKTVPGAQTARWGDQLLFVVMASDPMGNKIFYDWDGPLTALSYRKDEPFATLDTTKLKRETAPYPVNVKVRVKNEHGKAWSAWEDMPFTLMPQQNAPARWRVKYVTKVGNPAAVTQPGNSGAVTPVPAPNATPAQPAAPAPGTQPSPAPPPTASPGLAPKAGGEEKGRARLRLRSQTSDPAGAGGGA